jgi:DNA repair protein RecN (Recombination protein N)
MVSKRDEGKVSVARINILGEEERVEELAKMLSGDPPTEAAVLNAKELINN